jgi:hypothetical protein
MAGFHVGLSQATAAVFRQPEPRQKTRTPMHGTEVRPRRKGANEWRAVGAAVGPT